MRQCSQAPEHAIEKLYCVTRTDGQLRITLWLGLDRGDLCHEHKTTRELTPPTFASSGRKEYTKASTSGSGNMAAIHAEKNAIEEHGLSTTYLELEGLSNALADRILSAAGKDLTQVAILLPNSTPTIVAMLAALKARKAYVPLASISQSSGCEPCLQTLPRE